MSSNLSSLGLNRWLAAAVCFLFLLGSSAFAEVITFEDNWGRAGFNLVQQDAGGVEIVFSVTEMALMDIDINGEAMKNVIIPGVVLPNNAGAPNLPGKGRFIAIPEGAWAEFELVDYRSEVYHDLNIAPAFVIPRGDDDRPLQYEKDPAIYNLDANYPESPVMMSEVTDMRGVDAVTVGITPFQYNPVTKELTVYMDIRVRVNFYGGSYYGEDRLRSRWWEPVLQQNLLNYSALPKIDFDNRPQTDEDNVEYLIIVPDDPWFIAWADTLKRWRNEQGIITGITTLTEIGGNNATLIENYINNAYATWDPAPVAVLLLSDFESSGDVYGITAPFYSGTASDNMYADINGNNLPNLNIARICAQTPQQLQTMIGKMLSYERFPYTDPGFYDDPLIAGGWQTDRWFILCCDVIWGYFNYIQDKRPERQYSGYTNGQAPPEWSTNQNTYMIIDYFGPTGLGYIPATPSHLTDWTGDAAGINAAINEGTFLLQHRDHGSVTGWGDPAYNVGNVNQLTNTMYPYVWSINCLTGQYNGGTECFAEAFHRSQYGALGVTAASATSYSFVNDTYVWGIYDSMWPDFDPGYGADPVGEFNLRPGFANASGKYYLEASNWPYNQSSKPITYHLFHHHGDAFMTLFSEVPQNLTVLHDGVILGGIGDFTVTADADALIGLSVDGTWIGAAEATGAPVTIPIDPLIPGQIMRVTVTKANYYRYMADVDVIPPSGPWVTFEEAVVADDLLGNNNGQLDYGETSHLTISAENIGIETATGVTLNISTADPLLTIIDGTEYVGDIAAGAIATADHGFSVALDPSVEDGHIISMVLEAVSDTTWESNFAITAHAPDAQYTANTIVDPPPGNQNGNLDPGESGTITVTVTNEGSSNVPDLMVDLTTADPYVTITAASINVGTLAAGGSADATWDVSVSATCPQEHSATLDLAFSGGGYTGSDNFDIIIGDLWYAPTGPDAYGYYAYDINDGLNAPEYNWIEVAPAAGGSGTELTALTLQDDRSTLVDLPFTFTYYGLDYNDLTVCTNGWLAMGNATPDSDWSNTPIPDPDGPPAMIAPFWEDMNLENGGQIATYYDMVEGYFVVEFYRVPQWSPATAIETFEVVFYDPAIHPTPTGDGKILMQYYDINDATECGVGIENQSETVGLQYLNDGSYDIHATPIGAEMAVLYMAGDMGSDLDVTLTPFNPPIQIPAVGGSFDFNIAIANNGATPVVADVWCDITLPNGNPYGPTIGPINLTMAAGFMADRDRTQDVPALAPTGMYAYNAYIGTYPDVVLVEDTFPFEKLATGDGAPVDDWNNTGESFEEWMTPVADIVVVPEEYSLGQNYPNPFNPLTSISFSLPEASFVKLAVYDLQGRMVAELVNGLREASIHTVTWDASNLASGLYFYRIEAGDFTSVKKMVLVK